MFAGARSRELIGAFLAGLALAGAAAILVVAALFELPGGAALGQAVGQSDDRSYTQVESMRGRFEFGPSTDDTSQEQVETLRGNPPGR